MKLTDEIVANMLGWTDVRWRKTAHGRQRLSGLYLSRFPSSRTPYNVPAYTESLDAIVGEIEAREIYWKVEVVWGANKKRAYYASQVGGKTDADKTAALALCQALLAFLKESK